MMTNSISIRTSNEKMTGSSLLRSIDIVGAIAGTRPFRTLSEMYSGLMEEYISPRLTFHLVSVQVAAFLTIMPAEMPMIVRVLCLAWGVASAYLAKLAQEEQ